MQLSIICYQALSCVLIIISKPYSLFPKILHKSTKFTQYYVKIYFSFFKILQMGITGNYEIDNHIQEQ